MPDKGFHVEWVRFIVKRVPRVRPSGNHLFAAQQAQPSDAIANLVARPHFDEASLRDPRPWQ
jgi:hypothetical protein